MHLVNFVIKYFVDSKDTFNLNIIVYRRFCKKITNAKKTKKTKQNKTKTK